MWISDTLQSLAYYLLFFQVNEEDLEEDFDPVKYDKRMTEIFEVKL